MISHHRNLPPRLGFITLEHLAEQLETSPRTIRRWVQHGQLPAPQRLGRSTFWSADSIREALLGKQGGNI